MKILIIIGSAPCVLNDIEVARNLLSVILEKMEIQDCDFMAIGLDAVDKYKYFWPFKYVATNHFEDIPAIRAVVPFDISGHARRNDGTGAAGAYEYRGKTGGVDSAYSVGGVIYPAKVGGI
jgi:hypothetical protein